MRTKLLRNIYASLLIAATLFVTAESILAQERGFGAMETDPNTPRKSTAVIKDPTGTAPTEKVRIFKIEPVCSTAKYGDGKTSDCTYNSTRSERTQRSDSQPTERWYGWSFFLPADFPVGKAQNAGGAYTFGQWHNGHCPHAAIMNAPSETTMLYVETSIPQGGYDCGRDRQLPIADMRTLLGRWTKIEVFARWAKNDGVFRLYLNGELVIDHRGRTLTQGYENSNYFKYGVYHCCTKGVELINPYEVLYSNVKSAATREGLQ